MEPENNHYRLLGLDISASRHAIRVAVDALARRADELSYTSPERSHELWRQIRQIRSDLLSTLDRRQAYDVALLRAMVDESVAIAEPLEIEAAPVPSAITDAPIGETGWTMPRWAPLAAVAAVMALAASVAAVTQSLSPNRAAVQQPTPGAVALAPSPQRGAGDYRSGQTVDLRWRSPARATRYRVQLATSRSAARAASLFRHPASAILTSRPSYSLRVVGAQEYFWRVQSLVRGRWTAFSRPVRFSVAQPQAATPQLIAPDDYALLTSTQVRLCWTSEPGVAGYRVRVDRVPRQVRSRCIRVAAKPGFHHWSVASLVQGVQLYRSSYSPTGHFTVRPATRPATVARAPSARRIAAAAPPRPRPAPNQQPAPASSGASTQGAPAGGAPTVRRASTARARSAPSAARRPSAPARRSGAAARRPGPAHSLPVSGIRAPGVPTAQHGSAPAPQAPPAPAPTPVPPAAPAGVPAALPPTSAPLGAGVPASRVTVPAQRPARHSAGPNRATGIGVPSSASTPVGRSVSHSAPVPFSDPVPATSPAPARSSTGQSRAPARGSAPAPLPAGHSLHSTAPSGQVPPGQRHP